MLSLFNIELKLPELTTITITQSTLQQVIKKLMGPGRVRTGGGGLGRVREGQEGLGRVRES